MEFKNKQKKGWILEEIEKKTECLESKDFGGEEPEDVEKHQEEVNKEINKRFDGVKKVAQKVVGQDFEEHAKPHKVEVYYVGRKDLGEAIGKLKEQNITYTVKRSPKEGFRYVVEYYSTEHKKDEPLLEKIDLEEEDTNEGMISGAEELSHDELANLEKSLWDKLGENEIHPEDGTFSNSSNRLADLDLYMVIDGDWKHDHLFAEHLVEEWCKENGYVIIKHTSEEIGDSDRDDYKAEHHWFLVKDTDGKMNDTVNTLHQMFTSPEDSNSEDVDESLEESITFEVNDDGDLVAKSKDNYLIIGSEEDKDLSDEEKKKRMMKVLKDFKNDDTMKSEYDYWMSVLNEVLDDEELPDAIPEEPIVISTEPEGEAKVVEEPTEEVKKAGLYNALSSELRDTLQDIENLKSLTVTFIEEGREDLIDDLNAIIDERTIHSGMLQQLMTRVEGKVEAEETNTEQVKEESLKEEVKPTQSQLKALIKKYFNDGDYGYDMYKVIADKYPTLTAKEVFDAWVDLVDSDGGFKKVFPDKNEKEMKAREMRFISKYFKTKEESLKEDVAKREYSDEEIERAKKFQAFSLSREGRRNAAKEVREMSNSEFIAEFLDVLGSEGLDELIDMSKNESLKEDAFNGYARKPYDNLSAEEEQIRHELEWDLGAKEDKMGMTLSHAYDDMMRDYKYVRGNENAMNKLMKAFNISKEDLIRYIDYKQDGLLVPKDGHKTRESLEEAKEETINLDKYEIDDKDSAEQKEDAKIMPYGEVTKKQWEDFLSKAKWPYWLTWENLKNEVEHKD